MVVAISTEYRQRKREFKNSCRIYISEKSHLLSLEKKYPFLKNEPATEDSAILHVGIFSDLNEAQRIIYSYKHVKENTEYVDTVFADIENNCGSDAKHIKVYESYIPIATKVSESAMTAQKIHADINAEYSSYIMSYNHGINGCQVLTRK